jgi:hypothetical protein
MKNFRVVSLLVAALVMGSVVQAQQTRVQANVPFNFLIGDNVYPAGEYIIGKTSNGTSTLRVDYAGEATALVFANTCSSLNPSEKTKLVFHRVGDTYFLYQIWTEGNDSGLELPRSKTEIQMASNQPKSDLIVAANIVH